MHGSRKFCQRGYNTDKVLVFFVVVVFFCCCCFFVFFFFFFVFFDGMGGSKCH